MDAMTVNRNHKRVQINLFPVVRKTFSRSSQERGQLHSPSLLLPSYRARTDEWVSKADEKMGQNQRGAFFLFVALKINWLLGCAKELLQERSWKHQRCQNAIHERKNVENDQPDQRWCFKCYCCPWEFPSLFVWNNSFQERLKTVPEAPEAQEEDTISPTDERWKGVDSSNYDPNATIKPMPPLKRTYPMRRILPMLRSHQWNSINFR